MQRKIVVHTTRLVQQQQQGDEVHHPHTINIFTVLQNPSITVLRTYTGSFTLHLNRHTSGVCDGAYFVKRSEEVIRIEVLTKKKKFVTFHEKNNS